MTPNEEWYSAKLRLVCLVEEEGAVQYRDTVILFKGESFEHAFRRALEIGAGQEAEYLNGAGLRVLWRLKEILTLDFVSDNDLDGVEVSSDPVELAEDESYAFDAEFVPESSETTQTI